MHNASTCIFYLPHRQIKCLLWLLVIVASILNEVEKEQRPTMGVYIQRRFGPTSPATFPLRSLYNSNPTMDCKLFYL